MPDIIALFDYIIGPYGALALALLGLGYFILENRRTETALLLAIQTEASTCQKQLDAAHARITDLERELDILEAELNYLRGVLENNAANT